MASKTYKALAHFGFDGSGRHTWTASHLGIVTRNSYDTEGHLLAATTQSASFKQTQSHAYDVLGRLIAATDAAGGTRHVKWNGQGLPDVVTDALGREKRYRYDAMGKLVEIIEAANTVQARMQNTAIRFEHDALGQIAAVIAPNDAATRTVRDDFGRTTAVISADSGTVTRNYDAGGRLIASTDANGNHASYAYDVAGRIVKQTVIDANPTKPAQTLTLWKYEGKRLVAIDHPGQAERYRYDEQGHLARKTVILKLANGAQASSITRYGYDALGQLASTSLADGSTIDYKRNGQNQVVALERSRIQTPWLRWLLPAKAIVHDLERDIVGLKRLGYGNGIEAHYQRSPEGVLARIVYRHKNTLIDHRYLWDVQGNLLHTQSKDAQNNYVYDAQDRLIISGSAPSSSQPARHANYSRYFHDGAGNRVLGQEDIADQADMMTNTVKATYVANSNRWQGATGASPSIYDASGQPGHIGQREYVWGALGKLIEVRQEQRTLASYRYNHKGERIGKTTKAGQTHYLYEGRQLTAELNDKGQIIRQYVYLADQAIAVIDTPQGSQLDSIERSPLAQIGADIATAFKAWFSSNEAIAYLHNNHLGATELVTDANGNPIWQAAYSPYGKIVQVGAPGSIVNIQQKTGFKLNLRLPGQYEDDETGLYYNDHRYYDPNRGQYLTPDPLGLRGGINSYAYAANNPLKYIDPSGLILFAFDGTNNSNPPPINKNGSQDDWSNVYKFYLAYDETENGPKWYMNGVGRDDPNSRITSNAMDELNANTARARVDFMLARLDDYMGKTTFASKEQVNIDIVGFSRGAAMARDFSNRVAKRLQDNTFQKSGACVQIHFMGLWDTVAQFGMNGTDNGSWQLAIPEEAKNVFHAVALNEYRYLWPGESIGRGTQRGFIGSHNDIGGSYGTGDLSDVALNWIVEQAKTSGVKMKAWDDPSVAHQEWGIVTNPVLHDKSINSAGRAFCLRKNNEEFVLDCQRQTAPGGMTWSQTQTGNFINFYAQPTMDADGASKIVGIINMKEYAKWIEKNYGLVINYSAP